MKSSHLFIAFVFAGLLLGVYATRVIAQVNSTNAVSTDPGYDGLPDNPQEPVTVRIISPLPDEIIDKNSVDLFFNVKNYRLAEGGNRLHVIFDNNSPLPHHDVNTPLTIKELAEGGHTVRVFAVKPDGRTLTNPEAFAMVRFFVRKKDFQAYTNPQQPFLSVNLPLDGVLDQEYGDRIWLDFRAHNAPITKGGPFLIHYRMNNVDDYIEDEEPVYWQGLKPGRYELIVELVDPEKKLLTGSFNQVKRVFDVRSSQKAVPLDDPHALKSGNAPEP